MYVACRSRDVRARSYLMVVRGSAWEAASCTSRSGTPASSAAVMNACLRVCGPDFLGDPGPAGDPADDPSGAVPVQPPPIGRQEDGTFTSLADRQVDCPGGARRERDGDDLPALAGDHQGAVPTLNPERLDIGVCSF
jgi:hypothetical protein